MTIERHRTAPAGHRYFCLNCGKNVLEFVRILNTVFCNDCGEQVIKEAKAL